jgi:hypothetical protein
MCEAVQRLSAKCRLAIRGAEGNGLCRTKLGHSHKSTWSALSLTQTVYRSNMSGRNYRVTVLVTCHELPLPERDNA